MKLLKGMKHSTAPSEGGKRFDVPKMDVRTAGASIAETSSRKAIDGSCKTIVVSAEGGMTEGGKPNEKQQI